MFNLDLQSQPLSHSDDVEWSYTSLLLVTMDPFVQHFQKQPKCLAIDFDGVLSHTNAHFVVGQSVPLQLTTQKESAELCPLFTYCDHVDLITAHNIAFPDNQVTYEEIQWYWLHRCRGWGSKSGGSAESRARSRGASILPSPIP